MGSGCSTGRVAPEVTPLLTQTMDSAPVKAVVAGVVTVAGAVTSQVPSLVHSLLHKFSADIIPAMGKMTPHPFAAIFGLLQVVTQLASRVLMNEAEVRRLADRCGALDPVVRRIANDCVDEANCLSAEFDAGKRRLVERVMNELAAAAHLMDRCSQGRLVQTLHADAISKEIKACDEALSQSLGDLEMAVLQEVKEATAEIKGATGEIKELLKGQLEQKKTREQIREEEQLQAKRGAEAERRAAEEEKQRDDAKYAARRQKEREEEEAQARHDAEVTAAAVAKVRREDPVLRVISAGEAAARKGRDTAQEKAEALKKAMAEGKTKLQGFWNDRKSKTSKDFAAAPPPPMQEVAA